MKHHSLPRLVFTLGLLAGLSLIAAHATTATLVPAGGTWKYLDNGSDQGSTWRAGAFDDSAWKSGPAELGYGDGDEATVVSYGPNSSAKYVTTYFRRSFTVTDATTYTGLTLRLLRDDGAIVYLNGAEIYRSNMPAGAVTYTTWASTALGTPDEATFIQAPIPTAALQSGDNLIAVEIHQANGTSTDVSFDLELTASDQASVTRGPYLQTGTPSGVIVRWRTDLATDSVVRYGTDAANLSLSASNPSITTEHEVALSGLNADTGYYYSVGTSTTTLATGNNYVFYTPPVPGTVQPIRVWVLGDSGTADVNAAAVRNAYYAFAGTRYTDLLLMLGDNAYNSGTDAEYQAAVFGMYPEILPQTVLWPTIGNHDTAQSINPSADLPYFKIFTLPTNGEAGGLASGTEKYYSFDYGNIHFVCLDSMTSNRSATGPMLTWLKNDLANQKQDWIIAFWHHPPYSKGSHNSDTEAALVEMRANALPILESYGVDLVLSGHSHSYERSFLLDSHYGDSSTLTASNKLDAGSGREDGTGAYHKPLDGNQSHNGAVYAVAGSSGQISGGALNHPAMFVSLNELGSMVLDVDGNRLDAKFLNSNGTTRDYFTIKKVSTANVPPTVSLTAPTSGATYTSPASVTVSATAADSDGTVASVEFFASGASIGVDSSAPHSVTWSGMSAGTYTLTAVATDNAGAKTTSSAAQITVNPSPTPAAPTALTASSVSKNAITLSWTDNSSNEQSFLIERATSAKGSFSQIGQVAGTTSTGKVTYSDSGLTANTSYTYRVRAANGIYYSAYSNTATAKTKPK